MTLDLLAWILLGNSYQYDANKLWQHGQFYCKFGIEFLCCVFEISKNHYISSLNSWIRRITFSWYSVVPLVTMSILSVVSSTIEKHWNWMKDTKSIYKHTIIFKTSMFFKPFFLSYEKVFNTFNFIWINTRGDWNDEPIKIFG